MAIKKIAFFAFIIFSLFAINGLVHSIYDLWQKHDLVDREKRTLTLEKQKNIELKKQLKDANKPQFIEKEARDKLFLVRPGEGIVVAVPTLYTKASPVSEDTGQDGSFAKPKDKRPNWRQWWETFFGY